MLDGTADAASGQFILNGVAQQAGIVIELAATDLGTLQFQAAPGAGADLLSVSASDGSPRIWPSPSIGRQRSPAISAVCSCIVTACISRDRRRVIRM